ncbi:MAG: spore germination protein [Tumebacillaceae bacterium]
MKLGKWLLPKGKHKKPARTTTPSTVADGQQGKKMAKILDDNLTELKRAFGKTVDFKFEHIHVGVQEGLLLYLETMISSQVLVEEVCKPLALAAVRSKKIVDQAGLDALRKDLFVGCSSQLHRDLKKVVEDIMDGYAVVIVQGIPFALTLKINKIEQRGIEEPSTQTIVRGPKDGFTEILGTNMSLIRRRIKNPKLQFESFTIGKETRTQLALGYMDGVINSSTLKEIRTRIQGIQTNAVFDSGNIEEFIQDKTFTPFPMVFNTERPDTAAAQLLEGKAVILLDGSPFVLVVPTVMIDFFQSPEDYYQPYYMGSFIRMIRYLSFFIALLLPALYLSIITYHHELLPTQLLISLAAQREGVPFPAVVEVVLMELTFEIIREAGIRMPRAVGQAVSIVGALVIGQAAVEAGIVSNTLVIVVALTGLSSFASPIYALAVAVRILRFILILLAAVFGLYGMVLGLIIMVAHLASLRSFGVPYLAPVAPLIVEDLEDVFVRFPIWAMKWRPSYLNTEAPLRQPESKSPTPPPQDKGGDGS